MCAVVRVLVAAGVVVATADPGPKLLSDIRLPAAFCRKRSGALRQVAPTPALQYAPSEEIKRACTRRRGKNDVSAVGPNVDAVVDVGSLSRGRAIVGLQDRTIIVVENSEDAPLGIRRAKTRVLAQRGVGYRCLHPSPSVHLVNAARRNRAHCGEI